MVFVSFHHHDHFTFSELERSRKWRRALKRISSGRRLTSGLCHIREAPPRKYSRALVQFMVLGLPGLPGLPTPPIFGMLGAPGAPGTLLLYIQIDVSSLKVKEQLTKIWKINIVWVRFYQNKKLSLSNFKQRHLLLPKVLYRIGAHRGFHPIQPIPCLTKQNQQNHQNQQNQKICSRF